MATMDLEHMRFYVSPEDLLNTPSRKDGMDEELETNQRIYACEIIQEAGILLKLPQVTISTAQVLVQRFYYRTSLTRHNSNNAASSCLFLACKVAETPRKTRDILSVFHRIRWRRGLSESNITYPVGKEPEESFLEVGSKEYWTLKDDLINTERFILKELGFIVYVVLPHKYVLNFIKIVDGSKEFTQKTWNYVNDSLRTPVSVIFSPSIIAVACMYLAARTLGISLPEEPKPWWELFDTNFDQITEVCWYVQSLYGRKKTYFVETHDPRYQNKTFDEEPAEVAIESPVNQLNGDDKKSPSPSKRRKRSETPPRRERDDRAKREDSRERRNGDRDRRHRRSNSPPRRSRTPPRRDYDRRDHYDRRDDRDRNYRQRSRSRSRSRERRN